MPSDSELIKNSLDKGYEYYSAKYYQDSLNISEAILSIDPENFQAKQLAGISYNKLGKFETALELFQSIPENLGTLNSIALNYMDMCLPDEAILYFKKCLSLDDKFVAAINNIGCAYTVKKQYKKAIQCFKKLGTTESLLSISNAYGCLNDVDSAILWCNKVLDKEPNNPNAHFNRAMYYGLQGKWTDCFNEMEYKWGVFPQYEIKEKPRWSSESLIGKRVLVYSEQASGDLIQFIRYTKKLKELGAYVILECSSDLHGLLSSFADEIRTKENRQLDFDYYISAISFPYYFGVLDLTQKYITANKSPLDWSGYSDVFKIGVIWAGSPYHPNDSNRSFDCKLYEKICKIKGVKVFSLQKDVRKRFWKNKGEIDLCVGTPNMKMVGMKEYMGDWADTASIIAEMDLVISVDTAIAHLAGAMGKKCWLLLPFNSEWRWSLSGASTIWYDNMKIFRQKKDGNWKCVIREVIKELTV